MVCCLFKDHCQGLRGEDQGGVVQRSVDDPLTQPSPPEGGEGFIVLALSLWERVG